MTDTKVLSIRLPADLAQTVEDLAVARGLSRSEVLLCAIIELLDNKPGAWERYAQRYATQRQVSRPPVYSPKPHKPRHHRRPGLDKWSRV